MASATTYKQKYIPILVLLLLFSCSSNEITSEDDTIKKESSRLPQESNSTETNIIHQGKRKDTILAYFDSLIKNKQIIVGQHCGDGADATASYYDTYIDILADETGRHAGLMGADFGFFPSKEYPVQTLIDHWNAGGLVAVSWHAGNPFLDGYDVYWNTVENSDKINLKTLVKGATQTKVWVNYRTELDNIAGALQELREAGVTVIWRPFHEMNGDFFWWGINAYNNKQTNESDFKVLWVDLYNTLTFDYGLDNLIWTYSVIPDQGWNADVTTFYPGSDYVDLVGMDYYGVTPDFPNYEALKSLGKTIVMSESGPIDNGYGNWNMMQLVNTLKGKAAYFLQWHSWNGAKVAIKDNKNIIEMMQSETVITRDELPQMSY